MKSFRNPKYIERYEDVVFDLEQALDIDPANTAYQNRVGLKIVANNNYANHCVNIKDLLEYNPSYAESFGTNEFYFLDTIRSAEEIKYTTRNVEHGRNDANTAYEARAFVDGVNATYNKGFAARKALLGLSSKVNCEIPLNRYSFIEALEYNLLPNTKIDLEIEYEKDQNLIWRQEELMEQEAITD